MFTNSVKNKLQELSIQGFENTTNISLKEMLETQNLVSLDISFAEKAISKRNQKFIPKSWKGKHVFLADSIRKDESKTSKRNWISYLFFSETQEKWCIGKCWFESKTEFFRNDISAIPVTCRS